MKSSIPLRVVPAAFTACLLLLGGCSGDPPATTTPPASAAPTSASGSPSTSGSPAATPGETPAASESPRPVRNDLAKGSLRRALKSGALTVSVGYSTSLPTKNWQALGAKPLRISLTANNNSRPGQKIYLNRVTANVTVYDDGGPLESPPALEDESNLTPGFIVSYPTTYGQSFTIRSVDEAATRLTIDLTYELVLQVGAKDSKDYSKQTVTDTLVIPIAQ